MEALDEASRREAAYAVALRDRGAFAVGGPECAAFRAAYAAWFETAKRMGLSQGPTKEFVEMAVLECERQSLDVVMGWA